MNRSAQGGAAAPRTPPFYSTHEGYSSLIAAAHRRRVTPLGSPALTRHLVFWNPIDRPEPSVGKAATDWTRVEHDRVLIRKVQSDRLVAAIYRNLVLREGEAKISGLRMTHPNSRRTNEPVPLFRVWMSELNGELQQKPEGAPESDAYRALKIHFDWQGLPTVLSMELHAEYLTLTTLIDLSQPPAAPASRPAIAYPGFPGIRERLAELGRLYDDGVTDEGKWQGLQKFIYYDVWDRFEEIIFDWPGIDAGLKESHGVRHPKRFIDFRGLLLAVEPAEKADSGAPQPAGSAPAPPPGRLRAPFSREPQPATGNEREACCRTEDFDRIWPFLKSGFEDKNTEFTLSRYLGDRAFFATALAEQPGMVGKPGRGPLCYLIFEDTLNTWQLGRLVYRIHRGGTARVAAMMHLGGIEKADGILARVERKLQESLQKATPLRDQDEDKEHHARDSLREDNDAIENMLAGISNLDGSLDFRIERSRYYVSQFERIAKSLRIRRVHGFQTYAEFVQQRLGPFFDYIDRVGHRHARIQSDRGLLLRRLLTLEALYEERFISRAQRVADGALYGILGPYYLISILDHARWLNSAYLWRVGATYSVIYLILLALKPSQRRPAEPRGPAARPRKSPPSRRWLGRAVSLGLATSEWAAGLRRRSPGRLWIRLLLSLGLAAGAVTIWYSAQPGGLDAISKVEDGGHD